MFQGTFSACDGNCSMIDGSSIHVVQNSTIFLTGMDAYGRPMYSGAAWGTFEISRTAGKSVSTLTGSYAGFVSVVLGPDGPYPGTMVIGGENNSAWRATSATGGFNSLKRSFGTIYVPITGFFPGGETASATITGSQAR